MTTRETTITTADDVALHVHIFETEEGIEEKRPLLLLHGWPNSGRIWRDFAAAMLLADTRFLLIAPTFRGYGDSDKPRSGYSVSRFAEDVLFVAGVLDLDRFSLMGHSMGGKIAQKVAARQPGGLGSLILLSPAFAAAAHVPEDRRASQRAIYSDPEKMRDLILGMMATPPAAPTLEYLQDDALHVSREAFDGWIAPMREEDFTGELSYISVPTLVVHGAKDPIRTEEALRNEVVERIPGATLSVLPNVGHLAPIEDPTVLALTVVNFLDRSLPADVRLK